ncbi:HlyD family secretion protein [Neokomagataea anthophila]|uniref:HlyD family efflux transporter periplasmic adaptor subunit n=1 Tax=Neokomagataea anthophila TaxID=2826925 RepID=A0ABS5E9B6_9PROT|nr:HlyD family efflux transporter periplasmic adaptor subunit [Neokomagataea anthophila]MBR0560501.1 HlyD family efflux transporter periplasmic adaptor subunit [Neokomagataea anthophila]
MLKDLYTREYNENNSENDIGKIQDTASTGFTVSSFAVAVGLLSIATVVIFTNYSRHLTAGGQIVPNSGMAIILSPVTGIASNILVQDGSKVSKNSSLLTIDVETHSKSGPTPKLVAAELYAEEEDLLREQALRKIQYETERQTLTQQNILLTEELDHERQAAKKEEIVLSVMQNEFKIIQQERRLGLATNQQVQDQLYSISQISLARSQLLNSESQTFGQQLSVQEKLKDGPSTLESDLTKISSQLSDVRQRIVNNEPKDNVEIISTTSGVVSGFSVHDGEPVEKGQQIAVILRPDTTLVAEVYLDDAAAPLVHKGTSAELELSAFPIQEYGLIHGTVIAVSTAPSAPVTSDRIAIEQRKQTEDNSETPVVSSKYRAWISLDPKDIRRLGDGLGIPAGSHVLAHLSVDTRPLYSWVMDPLRTIDTTGVDFSLTLKQH